MKLRAVENISDLSSIGGCLLSDKSIFGQMIVVCCVGEQISQLKSNDISLLCLDFDLS